MTNVFIKKVDQIAEDVFFHIEVFHNGEVSHEIVSAETLNEIIKRNNVEVTYDEEFETEEGETIEQAIDNADLDVAEIADEEGEYDVYFHKVDAKNGEVTYDVEGKFVRTYKTEKAARNKARTLATIVIEG